jgi:hypothetical protein
MMYRAQTILDGASFAALLAASDGRSSALRKSAFTGHLKISCKINEVVEGSGTSPNLGDNSHTRTRERWESRGGVESKPR